MEAAAPAVAAAPPPLSAAATPTRAALVIDGAYATIGARQQEGKRLDYIKLRAVLEELNATPFRDCWLFDQEPVSHRYQGMAQYYNRLKLAPPHGPQFQVMLYPMKKYWCHCKCGNTFYQNVQKGVDNGIATKMLSLAYGNVCDRFILLAGDGDFYDSLNLIRNVLQKDLWVVGYFKSMTGFRSSVSADLQQVASRVIWLEEIWPQVGVDPTPREERIDAQAERPRDRSRERDRSRDRDRRGDRQVTVSQDANHQKQSTSSRSSNRDRRNGASGEPKAPEKSSSADVTEKPVQEGTVLSGPVDAWSAAGSLIAPAANTTSSRIRKPRKRSRGQKRKRETNNSSTDDEFDDDKPSSEPKRTATTTTLATDKPPLLFTLSDISSEEDMPLPIRSTTTEGVTASTAINLADSESDG